MIYIGRSEFDRKINFSSKHRAILNAIPLARKGERSEQSTFPIRSSIASYIRHADLRTRDLHVIAANLEDSPCNAS